MVHALTRRYPQAIIRLLLPGLGWNCVHAVGVKTGQVG